MSTYVTRPTSACERVSRELSVLLSELHFPTRALGPITEARDLLLGATLDANEFYATERDELVRDVVQLRTELAAAVAERDRLFLAQAGNLDTFMRAKLRAEQAEARLAAIDAQPTLAIWGGWIDVSESNVPPDETELIARPAKD